MATTASSNLARLRLIPETTFGETPTVGNSKDIRFTGESLDYSITTETSKEIRSDRQIADLVQTGAETAGDIQFEMSYGTYDELIAAALGGTWATDGDDSFDTLTNGTDVPFFSIEKGFTDIDQYLLYRGMAVNTMSLDFSIGAILTGSFGFMGRDSVIANVSGVPAAMAPAQLTEVMNSASNFADLTVAGAAYPCGISKVSLATNGGLRAQKALGNLGACRINAGTFTPTGSLSIYFADGVIYDKYIKNTAFALSWSVSDAAGNQYTFSLPKVKITKATIVAGGLDTDVELAIDYQALFDPAAGHTIKITRTPAA
jgi:hypothetical protein